MSGEGKSEKKGNSWSPSSSRVEDDPPGGNSTGATANSGSSSRAEEGHLPRDHSEPQVRASTSAEDIGDVAEEENPKGALRATSGTVDSWFSSAQRASANATLPVYDPLLASGDVVQSLPRQEAPAPTSRPGAFREGFGRTARTTTNNHNNQDGQEDLSDSAFTRNNTSQVLYQSEELATNPSPLDSRATPAEERPSCAGLVQAKLVTQSQLLTIDELEVAEPVDTINPGSNTTGESAEQQAKTALMRRRRSTFLLGVFVFLVVLGWVIFVVVRFLGKDDSHYLVPTLSSSKTGTIAPSVAPTPEMVLALLPPSTQAIILPPSDSNNTLAQPPPQVMAYQWMLKDPYLEQYSPQRLIQRFALVTFYYATDGLNWLHQGGKPAKVLLPTPLPLPAMANTSTGEAGEGPPPPFMEDGQGTGSQPPISAENQGQTMTMTEIIKEPWLSYDTHECDWFSSFDMCRSDHQTVTILAFHQNLLAGTLPEEIHLLTALKRIEIFTSYVAGTIPSTIGLLTNLESLTLNANRFSGNIPTYLGQLTDQLSLLSLVDNQLTGSLPSELWVLSNLRIFKVMTNALTGTIPNNLGDVFPNLLEFGVAQNHFTGSLPSSLGYFSYWFQLGCPDNDLTGTIPTEIARMTDLSELIFTRNRFSGTLPREIGSLSKLQRIAFNENPSLSGSIPKEWKFLNDTLQELLLEGTSLTGTILSELCSIPKLVFDCSEALCGCDICACGT